MFLLRTFGGLALHRSADDTPVGGPRRKPLAILALLAAAGDDGVSRDRIVSLLWPDDTDERGRRALAQSLYALRRETEQPTLAVGDGTLRLDRAVVHSDVAAFRAARRAGDHAAAAASYGEPFLDGVHFKGCVDFERWVDGERARLAADYRASLAVLAETARAANDPAAARDWLERAFLDDPTDEAAAAALVRAASGLGDRAAAIRVIRAHEAAVETDLGLAPSDGWRALVASVQLGAVAQSGAPAGEDRPNAARPHDQAPSDAVVAAAPVAEPASERPAIVVRRPRRFGRIAVIGAAAIVASVVGLAGARSLVQGRGARTNVARDLVAVFPFRAGGADSSLAYLGEGMVDLLTIAFHAGESPRVVDPRITLRALPNDPRAAAALSVDSLASLTRRVGAGRFVVGEVVGGVDHVTLHATLHDATGAPLADATVHGPPATIAALSERLTVALLLRAGAEPTARTAVLDHEPIEAVRLYLAGRVAYRGGRYERAAESFKQALVIDSTFAYAALGLANVAGFTGERGGERRAFALALANASKLTSPDRAYLRALASPGFPEYASFTDRIAAWEEATRRDPERPEAWYELGDQYYHLGRFIRGGDLRRRADMPFARAVALDSGFLPALEHLVLLAARRGDRPAVERAWRAYWPRDSASETARFLRWRVERVGTPTAGARESPPLAVDSLPLLTLRWIAELGADDAPSLGPAGVRDAQLAARALFARATEQTRRREGALAMHSVALNRGRPTEAIAWLDSAPGDVEDRWGRRRLAVLATLYGDADRAAGARAADAIERALLNSRADVPPGAISLDAAAREETPTQARGQAACALGQWLARSGQPARREVVAAVDRTVAEARAVPGFGDEARACALLLTAQRAGPGARGALDSLAAMLDAGVNVERMFPYVATAVALEYRRLGDAAAALRSAGRYDYFARWPYYEAAQLRIEADLALAAGDRRRAACALAHHVLLRDAPEPPLAARTAEARALLHRAAGSDDEPAIVARALGCLADSAGGVR